MSEIHIWVELGIGLWPHVWPCLDGLPTIGETIETLIWRYS